MVDCPHIEACIGVDADTSQVEPAPDPEPARIQGQAVRSHVAIAQPLVNAPCNAVGMFHGVGNGRHLSLRLESHCIQRRCAGRATLEITLWVGNMGLYRIADTMNPAGRAHRARLLGEIPAHCELLQPLAELKDLRGIIGTAGVLQYQPFVLDPELGADVRGELIEQLEVGLAQLGPRPNDRRCTGADVGL